MSSDAPRKGRGCAGIFFVFILIVGALGGAMLGVFVSILDDAKETITTLEDFRPKVGSKVYSYDGELLAEFSIEERQLMPLSEIPLHLQKAFIATEDHPFYDHKGVRVDAIARAALHYFRTGDRQGGSTITQQAVRNVEDLLVGKEVTPQRKIREAIVALQVEREFTKDEILELYLNQIFLGISAYGVEAASRQYFDKSCRDVTLGEAAMLAGVTRSPNKQEPLRNFENALARRDIVLNQMFDEGFITEEERDQARQEDLSVSVVTPEERAQRRVEEQVWRPKKYKAPYFVEEIRQFMFNQYAREEVLEGGMDIETTVDMRLQKAAEDALTAGLDKFDEKKLASLKARGNEDELDPVTGALVCTDSQD
ncbi:MAG: transglycosylase domain-containing protein [Candidatus Hydrogenedentes bacterium]|nr:transglycosylase domain-containing protein [Candidatus Hydrogenedentota bacterium]